MAIVNTVLEALNDSGSRGNGVVRYGVVGATSGTSAATVRAAQTGKQIYCKGQISASSACRIDFKSAADGTVVRTLFFLAKGTMIVRPFATKAGELLEIKSDTDVTLAGELLTMDVASGQVVPPGWHPE